MGVPIAILPGQAQLAQRYAQALLAVAKEQNLDEQIFADMQYLHRLTEEVPFLHAFFRNPVIPPHHKETVVQKVLGRAIHPLTQRFLTLLVRKNRLVYLRAIARAYELLYYKTRGMMEVYVELARPPSEELRRYLEGWLREWLPAQPVLKFTVDERLIGGIRIHVQHRTLDLTVRTQLEKFQRQVMGALSGGQ